MRIPFHSSHPLQHPFSPYTQADEVHYFTTGIRQRHIPTDSVSLAEAYADYFTVPWNGSSTSTRAAGDDGGDPGIPFGFDTTPSILAWRGPSAW